MLLLLRDLLDGAPAREVAETELGVGDSFSDARQKGIGYVTEKLRMAAAHAMPPQP